MEINEHILTIKDYCDRVGIYYQIQQNEIKIPFSSITTELYDIIDNIQRKASLSILSLINSSTLNDFEKMFNVAHVSDIVTKDLIKIFHHISEVRNFLVSNKENKNFQETLDLIDIVFRS